MEFWKTQEAEIESTPCGRSQAARSKQQVLAAKRSSMIEADLSGLAFSVPEYLTGDPLWRLQVYRLHFAVDISWPDVSKLNATCGQLLSDQLYRASALSAANIAEGYGKNSGKDRARFYEYALGSAREARTWYLRPGTSLGTAVVEHRCDNLTRIIRLLLTMLSDQTNVTSAKNQFHMST